MTNEFDKETQKIIADLDKQAKEIQAKIDELKSGPKNKNVRWRAEKDFCYYRLRGDGEIEWVPDIRTHEDRDYYNLGNYFKTEKEAVKYYNNLIITQKLKDIALRLNNGVEIDWENRKHRFGINYDCIKDKLNTWIYQNIHVGQIYCLSPKFLETAIKEIGEKELIEYIKGC